MQILRETDEYLILVKPAGVLSEESGQKRSVSKLLREQDERFGTIYSVHRLDREVGGVMLYAKTPEAAAKYSQAIRERRIVKEYLAVVRGTPPGEGIWEDLLLRDSRTMKTYPVARRRAGVRDAKLSFVRLAGRGKGEEAISLMRVRLYTGRTHQIRVQFASRRYPLVGDGRYGSGDGGDRPALFSCRLSLPGEFDVSFLPEQPPFDLFTSDEMSL